MTDNPQHQKAWRFPGVIALLITPFQADGRIDWPAYDAYVDWQASHRPHGLFAVCGSSEMKWLTADERLDLARRAVERAGDIPVVATANLAADIADHVVEMLRMAGTGVAGLVLTPPPQVSGNRTLYRQYIEQMVANAPLPLLLYEWPQVENHLMDADLFAQVAPLLAGIKDTTCTLEGISAKQRVAGDAVIYQANTPFMLDALEIGVRGIMAITSTVATPWLLQLWDGVQAAADMRRLHRELVILDAMLGLGYPASAKHLLVRQGLHMETYTRAAVTLSPAGLRALDAYWQGKELSIDNCQLTI
jgi:4-hydroxy-tetrahydrodipicolinate synthase